MNDNFVINPLGILFLGKEVLNLTDEQVALELKYLLAHDSKFFDFVNSNAKHYLFVMEGNANPSAERLADVAGSFLYCIMKNLEGGAMFFKDYMQRGDIAIYESTMSIIADNKNVG